MAIFPARAGPRARAGGRHPLSPMAAFAWAAATVALGAAGVLLAAHSSPFTAPAICATIALIAATLARPEIGIAAWFPLVPLGLMGVGDSVGPQWLLPSLWALFLFALAVARRGEDALLAAPEPGLDGGAQAHDRAASEPDRHGGAHAPNRPQANDHAHAHDRPHARDDAVGAHDPRLLARAQRLEQHLPPLAPALLALLAITLLEVILGVHPGAALKTIRAMVVGTLVFFAITTFVRNRLQLLWVLGGIALTAAFVGIVALNDYRTGNTTFGFFGPAGELVGRVTAGFGQPNQLGGFLAILVPLTIAASVLIPRARLLCLLATLLAIGGVYVSYSRGALLALAAIPFVFLGLKRSLVVVPVAFLALINFVPDVLKERFTTLTEGGASASRLDIWRAAEKIWSAHPLTGVGPGDFSQAYAEANIPGKAFLPSTIFQPPPHAHNLFLNLLAEQGLLGLLAFLALLGLALAGLVRTHRSDERWIRVMSTALLAMIAVFVVHNLFDVTLIEGTGEYVWALFGVCSALIAIEGRRTRSPPYEMLTAVSGARRKA